MLSSIVPEELSPKDYLNYLQFHEATTLGWALSINPEQMGKEFEKEYIQYCSKHLGISKLTSWFYIKMLKKLPTSTPNQFKLDYSILIPICKRIEFATKKFNLDNPKNIVFGTLNTGDVNAISIHVPKGGYIIALDSGVFGFLNLLSKALVQMFPVDLKELFSPGEQNQIDTNTELEKEGLNHFLDLLVAYLITGYPEAAKPYILPRPYMELASKIRDAAELFVVGHEYAHIALGHLDNSEKRRCKLKSGLDVEKAIVDKEKEFKADALGVLYTLTSTPIRYHSDYILIYSGIDLFFSVFEVIEKALSIGATSSHPSASERRKRIRESLENGDTEFKFVENALKFGEAINLVIKESWKNVEKKFYELLNESKKNVQTR